MTGRQGECRVCKTRYNQIKNKTRIPDQYREAGEKRRILIDFAGKHRIDSAAVCERFGHRCFKCRTDLSAFSRAKDKPLDHTLPVKYLWPLTTETATLLCKTCNGQKSEKWPAEVYDDDHLRELAVQTGLSYELLKSVPCYNPEAIEKLKNPSQVDALLVKHVGHIEEVYALRNQIIRDLEFDFFQNSPIISAAMVSKADRELIRSSQPSEASRAEGTDET